MKRIKNKNREQDVRKIFVKFVVYTHEQKLQICMYHRPEYSVPVQAIC